MAGSKSIVKMLQQERPSTYALTLVIPVGPHDEAALQNLLASIDRQAFPKEQLEVLICKEGNSEEARASGIRRAQGAIIGCLDADNQLLGFEFLQRLTDAAGRPDICGAYPSHYAWMRDDPPLNRYFALLGGNDPLCVWLGKADRRSWLVAPRTEHVVFRGSIPTLGTNGFFVKRTCIQPYLAGSPGHIDICERMRRAGHSAYTIVDAVIWHRTGGSLIQYLRKRWRYVRTLYWQRLPERDWHLVRTRMDALRVVAFAVASLLLLPQLWLPLRGYRRVKDGSWFLHPLVTSALTCMYGLALLEHLGRRLFYVRRAPTATPLASPASTPKRR